MLGRLPTAGRRGLLGIPEIARLATSARLIGLVRPHLAAEPRPVRSIFFDKTPQSNWSVAWHQDPTIAVRDRGEVEGFGPWSVKEGIPHVQPPVELLSRCSRCGCIWTIATLKMVRLGSCPAVIDRGGFRRRRSAKCGRLALNSCANSPPAALCSCGRCCFTPRDVHEVRVADGCSISNMPQSPLYPAASSGMTLSELDCRQTAFTLTSDGRSELRSKNRVHFESDDWPFAMRQQAGIVAS